MSERCGRHLMRDREKKRERGEREMRKGKKQFESLSVIDCRKRSQVLFGHDEKTYA